MDTNWDLLLHLIFLRLPNCSQRQWYSSSVHSLSVHHPPNLLTTLCISTQKLPSESHRDSNSFTLSHIFGKNAPHSLDIATTHSISSGECLRPPNPIFANNIWKYFPACRWLGSCTNAANVRHISTAWRNRSGEYVGDIICGSRMREMYIDNARHVFNRYA